MNILLVLGGLQIGLIAAWWLCALSFREIGRRRGIEETVSELLRGFTSHCDVNDPHIAKAVKGLKALSRTHRKAGSGSTDPYHAQLWIVGNAIGEACWLKGHTAGIRRKAPAEGKTRVDLSLSELLQLSWLAHLGFRYMMPNYRGFEIHRFSGEDDAREGSRAVAKIEGVIPPADRPFPNLLGQVESREKLICDWWHATPTRMTA
ncbi:MAG: hypothetical protein J0H40_24115 [Rhizobiales bacterium]|nr:hypothetical protein [Hyphomicrobiales bacterium]